MVEFGKTSEKFEGQATIVPIFYWGSESDENPKTGVSYPVAEYLDFQDEECYMSIRLGKDEKSPYLLGHLIKNCNGEIRDIKLDDFTIFIEK